MPLFKYQLGYLNAQLLQESKIFNTNLTKNMEKTWSCVFEKEKEKEKSRREPH